MSMFYSSPGSATVIELRSRASRLGEMVSSRKVANNTIEATYANGSRIILLHNTPIIEWRKDGTIIVNTGGYNSTTTRDRLNRFLPPEYSVYTSGGIIHLNGKPFRERVEILPDGTVDPDVTPKELLSTTKLIDRFMAHVKKRGLPKAEDSGGDPWVFSPDVGPEVMTDWLQSLYFTRRMYALALEFAGLQPYGIHYYASVADRQGGKLDKTDLSRLRRYIRSQIGLAR